MARQSLCLHASADKRWVGWHVSEGMWGHLRGQGRPQGTGGILSGCPFKPRICRNFWDFKLFMHHGKKAGVKFLLMHVCRMLTIHSHAFSQILNPAKSKTPEFYKCAPCEIGEHCGSTKFPTLCFAHTQTCRGDWLQCQSALPKELVNVQCTCTCSTMYMQ